MQNQRQGKKDSLSHFIRQDVDFNLVDIIYFIHELITLEFALKKQSLTLREFFKIIVKEELINLIYQSLDLSQIKLIILNSKETAQMNTSSSHYSIKKILGEGSYGKVFLCEGAHNYKFALKTIKRDLLQEDRERLFNSEVNAFLLLKAYKNQQIDKLETEIIQDYEKTKRALSYDQGMIFARDQEMLFEKLSKQEFFDKNSHVIGFIHHQKILQLTFEGTSFSCHAIFLEYAVNQSLEHYLSNSHFTHIPISIIRKIAYELFLGKQNDSKKELLKQNVFKKGLQEMHDSGIAHRDVKEGNIVFDSEFSLKLIDLSFSGNQKSAICGTDKYIAPELINKQVKVYNSQTPVDIDGQPIITEMEIEEKYEFDDLVKLDSFASGVVLFHLASKQYPFFKPTQNDFKYKFLCSKDYTQFWNKSNMIISDTEASTSQIPLQNDLSLINTFSSDKNEDLQDRKKQRACSTQYFYHSKVSNSPQTIIPHITHEENHTDPTFMHQNSFSFEEQIEQFKDLIQQLLQYYPSERITIKEALQHPFFSGENYFASKTDMMHFFNLFA